MAPVLHCEHARHRHRQKPTKHCFGRSGHTVSQITSAFISLSASYTTAHEKSAEIAWVPPFGQPGARAHDRERATGLRETPAGDSLPGRCPPGSMRSVFSIIEGAFDPVLQAAGRCAGPRSHAYCDRLRCVMRARFVPAARGSGAIRDLRDLRQFRPVHFFGRQTVEVLEAHDQRAPFVRVDAVGFTVRQNVGRGMDLPHGDV